MKYFVVRGTVVATDIQPVIGWKFSWLSPIRIPVGTIVDGIEITDFLEDTDGLYRKCAGEDKDFNRKLVNG